MSAADNLAAGITAGRAPLSASIEFEVSEQPAAPGDSRVSCSRTRSARADPAVAGAFVIDAPGDSVNVLLRVYTVAGR